MPRCCRCWKPDGALISVTVGTELGDAEEEEEEEEAWLPAPVKREKRRENTPPPDDEDDEDDEDGSDTDAEAPRPWIVAALAVVVNEEEEGRSPVVSEGAISLARVEKRVAEVSSANARPMVPAATGKE